MNIVIESKNLSEIQQVIDAENRRAKEHTISDARKILQLANQFEDELESIVGAKRRMCGAQVTYTSGGQVYSSYGYSRYINRLIMRRGPKKWHLIRFERISVRDGWARSTHISLTPAQHRDAVRNFQRQYTVRSIARCKSTAAKKGVDESLSVVQNHDQPAATLSNSFPSMAAAA